MKITLEIPDSHIDNALRQAHCGYWASELDWDGRSGYVIESEGKKKHRLSVQSIQHGISELARLSPRIFGKLLDDDLDGPMSDVLLQLCAGVVRTDKGHEGEVKYG